MKQLKKFSRLIMFLPLLLPAIASAQVQPPNLDNTGLPDLTLGNGINGLGTFVVLTLLDLAGIIAILFVIIGGFQYMTSAGNDEAAARGKKTFTNAIIGLVIILLSYTIMNVIFQTLSGA